ncbi:hypothetical protein BTN50_0993 [Candidatus Enterovibrio altilux]|uniref:Mobile element protein n=1 Tax=Candidatus Enterovibrio altilux TaxID=1927128 RepID=A0A291B937_9GAMM|nr:hypothetical protein BTN50_0993 [Candidatus Enterovibrio luxaltus]
MTDLFQQVSSTLPSVTFDAFNAAAIIACVFISIAKCNWRQTSRFPSVPCFFIFHSLSP